jgi:transcriptional regulator
MYQPSQFKMEDLATMRARPFATLVSAGVLGLFATHLPTITKDGSLNGALEFHLARANPHWEDLARGGEAMVIFQGSQAQISPGRYPSKADGGRVLPTWSYAGVHAYGRPEMNDDPEWLRQHVSELTGRHEAGEQRPWTLSDAPASFIEGMLRAIVSFRLEIARIEGKWKMSQNRQASDRQGVAAGLRPRATDADLEAAALVESLSRGSSG